MDRPVRYPDRSDDLRAKAMLSKMDELGFGNCTNTRACEAECPKNISISNIARLNRDFIIAKLKD